MIYAIWLSTLCLFITLCISPTANLRFFDKLHSIITQFDPVIFVFGQKKEKKVIIIPPKW